MYICVHIYIYVHICTYMYIHCDRIIIDNGDNQSEDGYPCEYRCEYPYGSTSAASSRCSSACRAHASASCACTRSRPPASTTRYAHAHTYIYMGFTDAAHIAWDSAHGTGTHATPEGVITRRSNGNLRCTHGVLTGYSEGVPNGGTQHEYSRGTQPGAPTCNRAQRISAASRCSPSTSSAAPRVPYT